MSRWLRSVLTGAALGAIVWGERRSQLRARTVSAGRSTSNAGMAVVAAGIVGPVQSRLLDATFRIAEQHRLGVLRRVDLAPWLSRAVGLVLLDYSLWWWHRLLHQVPALWRLHAAHHADVELTASTALRFHPLELLASLSLRVTQVVLLGVDRDTMRAWDTALLVAITFHHANLRLPVQLDRALARVVITPRMHGVHNSIDPYTLDTNFGTLLSLWDSLHGTRGPELDQGSLTLGILAGPRTTPSLVDSLALRLE